MASSVTLGSGRLRQTSGRIYTQRRKPNSRPVARCFMLCFLLCTVAGLSAIDVLIRLVVRKISNNEEHPSPLFRITYLPFFSAIPISFGIRGDSKKEIPKSEFKIPKEVYPEPPIAIVVKEKPPLDDVLRDRIRNAVKSTQDEKATEGRGQPFLLHILVVGACDGESLQKLVGSLSMASYVGDVVHLTVSINCSKILPYVKDIKWEHGRKRVIESGGENDEIRRNDPLRLWWPETDNEHLFLLPSNARISPGFYKALKTPIVDSMDLSRRRVSDRDGKESVNDFTMDSLYGLSLDAQATPLVRNGVVGGVQDGARPPRLASKSAPFNQPYLTHVMASGCQMILPKPWKKFWEWHEISQKPQISTSDGIYDQEAYDFSSTCREDWQASFLTFASEQGLFNLYFGIMQGGKKFCFLNPETDPLLALKFNPLATAAEAASSSRQMAPIANIGKLPQFDHCGRKLTPGFIVSNSTKLKELLGPISRDGAVVGVMVSPGYDDMLHNWLCYVKELAIRNYFVITQDRRQAERLGARGLAVYFAGEEGQGGEEKPLSYGSIPYKKFILARTKAIGEILHSGYNVLLADVDAIWLSDPFKHLTAENIDIFAQLEERGNPCGGFLYLIRTARVLQVWDLIIGIFSQHITWLETEKLRRDPEDYEKFLVRQQHIHEQKYLQDFLHQGRHPITLQGLDSELFINGRDYFDHKVAQMLGIVPVMIHNNYIVGKPNKVHRFKIKGMWRVDVSGTSCKCLTLLCQDHPAPWANKSINLPEEERQKRTPWIQKYVLDKVTKKQKVKEGVLEKGFSTVKGLIARQTSRVEKKSPVSNVKIVKRVETNSERVEQLVSNSAGKREETVGIGSHSKVKPEENVVIKGQLVVKSEEKEVIKSRPEVRSEKNVVIKSQSVVKSVEKEKRKTVNGSLPEVSINEIVIMKSQPDVKSEGKAVMNGHSKVKPVDKVLEKLAKVSLKGGGKGKMKTTTGSLEKVGNSSSRLPS